MIGIRKDSSLRLLWLKSDIAAMSDFGRTDLHGRSDIGS